MTAHVQTQGPLGQKVVRALQKYRDSRVVDLREFAEMKEELHRLSTNLLGDAQRFQGLDPVHAVYAAMQNQISILLEALSRLSELEPLTKLISEAEEEYMPEGPPLSPLTLSYFEMWAAFDASTGPHRETLGTCLLDAGSNLGMDPEFLRVLRLMQDSRMGLYVHQGAQGPAQVLRELVTGEQKPFLVPAGYHGHRGELWLVRTLPPPSAAFAHGLVFTTPYVMRGYGEREWQAFLERTLPKMKASDVASAYTALMKWGLSTRYWPEYIFEAYCGHEREVIYLTGLPDQPQSRPHSQESAERAPKRQHRRTRQPLPTGKKLHRFSLNTYPDARFTRCPLCEKPTKQRKFVLAIDIETRLLLAQGLTCRYCPYDDLIIVHQDVLEAQLAAGIGQRWPNLLGHPYLVLGTFERDVWREGLQQRGTPMEQMLPALHPFREVLKLEPLRWGWFPDDKH